MDITNKQLEILRDVYETDDTSAIPKMWAMYKEVAEYYSDGVSGNSLFCLIGVRPAHLQLEIPDDVSILFADDNYGNIMSVMPPDRPHPAGAGIYYHVDCEWTWKRQTQESKLNRLRRRVPACLQMD